jgi:hypothetical protein
LRPDSFFSSASRFRRSAAVSSAMRVALPGITLVDLATRVAGDFFVGIMRCSFYGGQTLSLLDVKHWGFNNILVWPYFS